MRYYKKFRSSKVMLKYLIGNKHFRAAHRSCKNEHGVLGNFIH